MNAPPAAAPSRWSLLLAGALLVLAGTLAYLNSFGVPFVLDDPTSIVSNPTIRHLWPLREVLMPPRGQGLTVEGRPLLNLSLAINYVISGQQVWSYHVFNLVIHLLAGLTLFGVVRQTLRIAAWNRLSQPADQRLFAWAVAALWLLHPLQTESVTYIVQRTESMMGLFFLLTLYGFIRGANATGRPGWLVFSVVCCLLGMATKEVMVGAPLVVLLYDYTFVSGSFSEAWRRHRLYYTALACTWLLLLALVISAGDRGGTIGARAGVAWWEYALTQSRGLVHYLALSFWPRPLIFDYGTDFVRSVATVWPCALVDLALLAATVVALGRRSALGFLGAVFFIVLAPTSSVLGGTRQMLAEHRMYLSLAAVVILTLLGIYRLVGRAGLWVGLVVAVGLGGVTASRNGDYHDALTLWADTVAKRPGNAWAQNNLGMALVAKHRTAEAAERFKTALQITPDYAAAHNNLGNLLLAEGRVPEAIGQFEAALQLTPNDADVHNDLANAYLGSGRLAEAIAHYRAAIAAQPDHAEAHNDLGNALAQSGHTAEAIVQYQWALRLDPTFAEVHNNWGNALAQAGDIAGAIEHYEQSLRLKPDYDRAHFNLANALTQQSRLPEAVAQYEKTLQLRPDYAAAHINLGNALARLGRVPEAAAHYEQALRIEPGNAVGQYSLANALIWQRKFPEAQAHLEEALRLQPNFPEAREVLNRLRAQP